MTVLFGFSVLPNRKPKHPRLPVFRACLTLSPRHVVFCMHDSSMTQRSRSRTPEAYNLGPGVERLRRATWTVLSCFATHVIQTMPSIGCGSSCLRDISAATTAVFVCTTLSSLTHRSFREYPALYRLSENRLHSARTQDTSSKHFSFLRDL